MKQKVTDNLIECASDIPLMPEVAHTVLNLIGEPKTQVEDLSEVIKKDPALTAKVMKMANSAFYWRGREIASLNIAILTLGYKALLGIVIASSTKGIFEQYNRVTRKNREMLWDHLISVALISGYVCKEVDFKDPETLFIAALLHDFGKLIISERFPHQFDTINKETGSNNPSRSITLEEDILGFSHQDLGGLLIEKWNLPKSIEQIVAHHHTPHDGEPFVKEAMIACLSDCIASHLGWNLVQHDLSLTVDNPLITDLNLSIHVLQHLISTVHKSIPEIKRIF